MRMKHASHPPPRRWMAGVGLIEALVALAVLALGVMGMAALQTRTLLESRASHGRAIAVRLATDLHERMRTNPGIRDRSLIGAAHPYQLEWGATPRPADCWQASCSPDDLASFDLMQWKNSLTHHLPQGDARVFLANADTGEVGILVAWPLLPGDLPAPVAPGVAAVACREGFICHQVLVRP
jgi:type IV pilus assembly protein PilV